jgi:hypothetical protein
MYTKFMPKYIKWNGEMMDTFACCKEFVLVKLGSLFFPLVCHLLLDIE